MRRIEFGDRTPPRARAVRAKTLSSRVASRHAHTACARRPGAWGTCAHSRTHSHVSGPRARTKTERDPDTDSDTRPDSLCVVLLVVLSGRGRVQRPSPSQLPHASPGPPYKALYVSRGYFIFKTFIGFHLPPQGHPPLPLRPFSLAFPPSRLLPKSACSSGYLLKRRAGKRRPVRLCPLEQREHSPRAPRRVCVAVRTTCAHRRSVPKF